MANEFTANDILEIAKKIEINGAKFYREAANRVTEEKHKQFLLGLADMEDSHEKTFAAMQANLKGSETAATAFDPEDESALYLKALADTRVFFEKNQPETTMKGILASAIGAEKDSIVFYLGMKELTSEKMGKSKIGDIIKEEMRHIQMLASKLNEFKST
ncbi:MAG: ferritin family protein [Proteobacteria bacterium]|nr:rubrerythrin [Desulfobacula sp.]MBU4129424.1 ferritin family protein [Pseudomonadota bacterium]